MIERRLKVLVGGIFHEGHSFSRLLTTRGNFEIVRGLDLLRKARDSASCLGGSVRTLEAAGVEVIPSLSAVAPPGGAIEDSVYEELKRDLIDSVDRTSPDAVVLDLHGAILTQSLRDPEGNLLEEMRRVLGEETPIGVAMDLHAYLTPTMLRNATICVACKENPHTDYADAGESVANVVVDLLKNGQERPATAAVWLPLVITAQTETAWGPLRNIHRLRAAEMVANPSILDISIYNTTPYLDAKGAGQCITVTARDRLVASNTAVKIAESLWAVRDEFESDRPSVESVLDELSAKVPVARPYVLGDQGDRVLAGAPGDGTVFLTLFHDQYPGIRAVVPVTDPESVEEAHSAGQGATLTLAIGGKYSEGVEPITATWTVIRIGDGRFVQKGPYLAGESANLGPTAVLRSGRLTVLVSSLPGFTQDPAAFESNGIKLEDQDAIVVKSGIHFKMSFADIGDCVVVDTPGLTNVHPGEFQYQQREGIYPDDIDIWPTFEAQVF